MKKKLLLVIGDCDAFKYDELLEMARKENENIDQILIDVTEKTGYCYGYAVVDKLTA